MSEADGRELWMLAHKYEVEGVKEWLMKHAITAESVCAAACFACECEADVCEGLLEACRKHASWSLPKVRESALAGVGVGAAGELLRAHAENVHLGRACDVAEGYRYAERWARANQLGCGASIERENKALKKQAASLVDMLELSRLPHSFLMESVKSSGLVSYDRLWQIHADVVEREQEARLAVAGRPVRLRQAAILSDLVHGVDSIGEIKAIITGGRGASERLAAVDLDNHCVYVLSLEDMRLLWVAGSKGDGPGQFMEPSGAAFDGRGNLWVCDEELHRVQVFDCEGRFVRCFGKQGKNEGELSYPSSISVTAQGDMLVCDRYNNRVQVFDEAGRFVRAIPAPNDTHQIKLDEPYAAVSAADGSIIVADSDCVRQFSSDGVFVKEIKPPHWRSEEPWNLWHLCAGPEGELMVLEEDETGSRRVCVLDADFALLWSAGVETNGADISRPHLDSRGRVFCVPDSVPDVYVFEKESGEGS